MRKLLRSLKNPTFLFLPVLLIALASNILSSLYEVTKMKKIRAKIPYVFMGYKFSGLKDILGDQQFLGYYTDKSLDERLPALQFAQAQYILAPIILDFNNTEYEYILFDCSQGEVAQKKIHELGVIPIRKNQFGIILAHNPGVRMADINPQ